MPTVPEKKRKTPKQARSRALCNDILDATIRVFQDQGYSRTTTARIAERAGISTGSLYQYYSNKQDIFHALAERHLGRVDKSLENVSDSQVSRDLFQSMNRMVDALLELDPEYAIIGELNGDRGPSPSSAARSGLIFRHVEAALTSHGDQLKEGVRTADVAFVLSGLVAACCAAAAHGFPSEATASGVTEELRHLIHAYTLSIVR